ncbi:transcription factor S [Candidatus Woesearchaeota archaeon]|nr:transcription factor S [Candidatus Woesearchaeota archaeon]
MEFCQHCGGVLIIKNNKAVCASCGKKQSKKPKITAAEKMKHRETVAVIKEEQSNTYPIVEIKCPQCKNKKAYFWTQQTRAGDESETKFYKCTHCKHTWRAYR